MSKAGKIKTPKCVIDRNVLNENTVGNMTDLGLSVFAKLCGVNRGAFVLDPPDGHTYGCLSFPESFSKHANIQGPPLSDSNAVTRGFASGNITASQTVDVVSEYVTSVYTSSEGVDVNPYGCDVNGLATLEKCPSSSTNTPKSLRVDGQIVKAVTLAGAFVPEGWVTGGKKVLTMEEVKAFYKRSDFQDMVELGVNTLQIPVPCDAFVENGPVVETLSHLLDHASDVGLSAILVLTEIPHDDSGSTTAPIPSETIDDHMKAAATYATSNYPTTILALQLPSPLPSLLSSIRSISPTLAVLAPINKGQFTSLAFPPDAHLFAALDVGASTSVADIASSDSLGDRMKMFYHESIVCIDRSPIEWLECFRDMPVYVTSGFDLGVDDCIRQSEEGFKDYGQCGRFDETVGSGWWKRHRESLAERQLFTYSRGLGWSFSGWKLYGEDQPPSGTIDTPAKLLCLRDVAAAGLIPELSPTSLACLNGPQADFAMGDATFAPTPAPPPNCGYGWWNATTQKCDYWIPPPPTVSPTERPNAPCPSCEEMGGGGAKDLAVAAVSGAVVALVLNWLVKKVCGGGRDEGYASLP